MLFLLLFFSFYCLLGNSFVYDNNESILSEIVVSHDNATLGYRRLFKRAHSPFPHPHHGFGCASGGGGPRQDDGRGRSPSSSKRQPGSDQLFDPVYGCAEFLCDFPEFNDGYQAALKDKQIATAVIPLYVIAFESLTGDAATTQAESEKQVKFLNQAFSPVGIQFELRFRSLFDPEAHAKRFVPNRLLDGVRQCLSPGAGSVDGACRFECNFPEFGWDYSACVCSDERMAQGCSKSTTECTCLELLDGNPANSTYCDGVGASNQKCDPGCNHPRYNWDSGDCCRSLTSPLCFSSEAADFAGTGAAALTNQNVDYFMDALQTHKIPVGQALVVVVHPWLQVDSRLGVASGPARLTNGKPSAAAVASGQAPGIVFINTVHKAWGEDPLHTPIRLGTTAIHELGHVFGLHHTFKGFENRAAPNNDLAISNVDLCNRDCHEIGSTRTMGDFCSDTRPTPENYLCEDPKPCSALRDLSSSLTGKPAPPDLTEDQTPVDAGKRTVCRDCRGLVYEGTAYRNIMSYSDDKCIMDGRINWDDVFTLQQRARARCYMDMTFLFAYAGVKEPGPVVLSPSVVPGGLGTGQPSVTVEFALPIAKGDPGSVISFDVQRLDVLQNRTAEFELTAPTELNTGDGVFGVDDDPLLSSVWPFVDSSAELQADTAYRYRVRPKNTHGTAEYWSPWSDAVRPAEQTACPNNCYGHGKCAPLPAGALPGMLPSCVCNQGWGGDQSLTNLAGVQTCALPRICNIHGCYESQLGDGKCQQNCLSGCEVKLANGQSEYPETMDCLAMTLDDGVQECSVMRADAEFGSQLVCPAFRWADGVCNPDCDSATCLQDFGDCETCDPGCQRPMVGDGVCDPKCNTANCQFDKGDCEQGHCNLVDESKKDFRDRYHGAKPCRLGTIGDGFCDPECNIELCGYDLGDCTEPWCAPGCSPDMIGDGVCQAECAALDPRSSPFQGACVSAGDPLRRPDGGDCGDQCAPGCLYSDVGNGRCDPACQASLLCLRDLFDCGSTTTAADEGCTCTANQLLNSVCDPACYSEACHWDKGGCGLPRRPDDILIEGVPDVAIYAIMGTLGGCFLLVLIPVAYCAVRHRRRQLKAKEAKLKASSSTTTRRQSDAHVAARRGTSGRGGDIEMSSRLIGVGSSVQSQPAVSLQSPQSPSSPPAAASPSFHQTAPGSTVTPVTPIDYNQSPATVGGAYICSHCAKSYDVEADLDHHIKLRHPSLAANSNSNYNESAEASMNKPLF